MKNIPIESYDNTYNAADKALAKISKDSDNEILEDIGEEVDPKKRREKEIKCIMVRKVVDKCMDEYREGEYTFKESMKQLSEALSYLK